jgi:hypothetical protein
VRDRKKATMKSRKVQSNNLLSRRSDPGLDVQDGGTFSLDRSASTRAETNTGFIPPGTSDEPSPVNSIMALELEKSKTNISDVSALKASFSVERYHKLDGDEPGDTTTADSLRRNSLFFARESRWERVQTLSLMEYRKSPPQ